MALIKNILNIPKECEFDNIIAKDNFELKARDQKIFTENIERIKLIYSLKEENIRIKPYKDTEREYLEVQVINITLKKDAKLDRIADIVLRAIPYPIILSFEFKNKVRLFVSHQKESLIDTTKITLEEIISTNWIDPENTDEIDKKLFKSLQIENLNYSNFYKFYNDIVTSLIVYNSSKYVGKDLTNLSIEKIKEIQDEIDIIDNEIAKKRAEIKKETQFNKELEINMKIHNLRLKKEELEKQLT